MLAVFFGTVRFSSYTQNTITIHSFRIWMFLVGFFLYSLECFSFRYVEIGDTELHRKISLCIELLEVAEILEPGKSIFRGKLLVDLQEAVLVQTERYLKNGEISKLVARVGFHSKFFLFRSFIVQRKKIIQLFSLFHHFRRNTKNSWIY